MRPLEVFLLSVCFHQLYVNEYSNICAGEVTSEWDAIRNATKLPVVSNDSWAAVVDGFLVNGSPVVFSPSLSYVTWPIFFLRQTDTQFIC